MSPTAAWDGPPAALSATTGRARPDEAPDQRRPGAPVTLLLASLASSWVMRRSAHTPKAPRRKSGDKTIQDGRGPPAHPLVLLQGAQATRAQRGYRRRLAADASSRVVPSEPDTQRRTSLSSSITKSMRLLSASSTVRDSLGRTCTRKVTGREVSKEQRPPQRAAVALAPRSRRDRLVAYQRA